MLKRFYAVLESRWGYLPFLLIVTLFNLEKVVLGPSTPLRFWDVMNFSYAFHKDYGDLVLKHGLFYWYPQFAAGFPAFANQFGPTAPLNFVAAVLPLWALYILVVLATVSLAGYGMYLFLRRVIQIDVDLAFLGSLLFMYCVAETYLFQEEFLFVYLFPLFLLNTSYLESDKLAKKIRGLAIAAAIISFSHPVMTTPYYAYSHLLVIWFIGPGDRRSKIQKSVGAVLIWFAYAVHFLPILYALFNYAPLVNRPYNPMDMAQTPALLKVINSYFYVMHIAFLLPAAAITAMAHKPLRKPFIAFAIATSIMLFFRLPFANVFQGTFLQKMDLRQSYSTVFFFSFVLLFAVLQYSVSSRRHWVRFSICVGIVMTLLLPIWFLWPETMEMPLGEWQLWTNILITVGILAYGWRKVRATNDNSPGASVFGQRLLAALSLSTLLLAGLTVKRMILKDEGLFFNKFGNIEFIRREINPERLQRTASIGLPNVSVRFAGREAFGGQAAFFYKPFAEYFHSIIAGQLVERSPAEQKTVKDYNYLLELMLPSWVLPSETPAFWYGLPKDLGINFELLKAMNVTHIVTTQRHPQLDEVASRIVTDGISPREPSAPLDRSSWLATAKDIRVKLDRLRTPYPLVIYELAGAKERILFVMGDDGARTEKNVEIISYTPDRIDLKFTAEKPGRLEISNNFHPNWRAAVNGDDRPVIPGDGPFQAVIISASGPQKVTLTYVDRPLMVLTWISQPLSFILLGLFYRRRWQFYH